MSHLKEVTFIVVGRGKLAQAVQCHFERVKQKYVNWVDYLEDKTEGQMVLIYASDGENVARLVDLINFCITNDVPFINGCTDFSFKGESSIYCTFKRKMDGIAEEIPKGKSPVFVNAPNWNYLIVVFMKMMKQYGKFFDIEGVSIQVQESHQSIKKSVAGTAVALASSLSLAPEIVESIRDSSIQENNFNVPREHLEGHAIHRIPIIYGSTELYIETRVMGRDDYGAGIILITDLVLRKKQGPVINVEDLIS